MKLLTLEQVVKALKSLKKPYLILKRKSGFDEDDIGLFDPKAVGIKEKTIEEQTEKSIQWLQSYIKNFPGRLFVLYAKTSYNTVKDGEFGPFLFSQEYDGTEQPEQNGSSDINGLSGMNHESIQNLGYVPKGQLEAEIAKKELEFQRERQNFEIEKLRAEMAAKFEMASQWSPDHINQIGVTLAGIVGQFTGKAPVTPLAGTRTEKQPQNNANVDNEKLKAVNSLAEELYKNNDFVFIEKMRQIARNANSPEHKETENKPEDE